MEPSWSCSVKLNRQFRPKEVASRHCHRGRASSSVGGDPTNPDGRIRSLAEFHVKVFHAREPSPSGPPEKTFEVTVSFLNRAVPSAETGETPLYFLELVKAINNNEI